MNGDSSSFAHHGGAGRNHKSSLATRAGVAHTFGGVGGFLAVMFLGAGVYLLQEAFSDPLRAQAVGLIGGAFILALSTILLYFLFSPRAGYRRRKTRRRIQTLPQQQVAVDTAAVDVAPPPMTLPDMPIPPPAKEARDGLALPA